MHSNINIIRLTYSEGDGRLGYESGGPYDVIHVGAAAPETPQMVKKEIYRFF